jgi:hypothetical protein
MYFSLFLPSGSVPPAVVVSTPPALVAAAKIVETEVEDGDICPPTVDAALRAAIDRRDQLSSQLSELKDLSDMGEKINDYDVNDLIDWIDQLDQLISKARDTMNN